MALPNYIEDIATWKDKFKYAYPITVRFSETDAFGHLNNTVPFVYFEEARINFFKDVGVTNEWLSKSVEAIPVTADLHCDYLKQVYFDEKLQVAVKVAYIGTSSVDLHYMITNETGEICLTGRGKMVQVSKQTGKPVPWSGKVLDYLEDAVN